MRQNNSGFSFVELVVVLSIIVLVTVIGVAINNNSKEKTENTKVTTDLKTIDNAVVSYKEDTKTLPNPSGNLKFFDDASSYAHDETTSFGVHGYVTESTFTKKYLSMLPLDPKTNQYYGYGKTLTGGLYFELAGVSRINGKATSFVVGDYSGESGPYNLIREYNGPDFVYDKSIQNFPYDPDERIMKAKLSSFSGTVNINGFLATQGAILTSGDKLLVSTGGLADVYFADGSKSVVGDSTKASELIIATMEYNGDTNLLTKIQLALNYGTVWTQASRLDSNSQFEVYTTDTEAAVRGTVFGVSKTPFSDTTVTVEQGIIKLQKPMYSITGGEQELLNAIKGGVDNGRSFNNPVTFPGVVNDNSEIDARTGVKSIKLGISIPSEGPILPTPIKKKINKNLNLRIEQIKGGRIYIKVPKSLTGIIDKVYLNSTKTKDFIIEGDTLSFTGVEINTNGIEREIRICSTGLIGDSSGNNTNCSKAINVKINPDFSFEKVEDKKESIVAQAGDYSAKKDMDTSNENPISAESPGSEVITTISFTDSNVSKSLGDADFKITHNNIPDYGTITYTSSNINVATVDNAGNIHIVGIGRTTITAVLGENSSGSYTLDVLCGSGDTDSGVDLDGDQVNDCMDSGLSLSDYTLVAYAPYDVSSDLNMYKSGGKLDIKTNQISSGYFKDFNSSGGTSNPNGVLLNANPLYITSYTTNEVNQSFAVMSNGVKGLYLETSGNTDYLAYSLQTGFIGNDFAIEMSVRGDALNRNNRNSYRLFNSKNYNLRLYNHNIYFKEGLISKINYKLQSSFSPNDFYKVIIKKDGSTGSLYINNIAVATTDSNISNIIGSDLYIGSSTSSIEQWNDIINYVKIYNK